MRYLLAFLVCCLTAAPLLGQDDLNLAQFYLTPAYLNPAFVGTTPHYRAVFHHRSQWNAIGATPNRQLASFEYNFITFDGGLGVQVLRTSFGGDLPWQSTAARLAYGQRIYLNRRWIIGGGLEVTYVNGGLDTDQLTFEDALLSGDPTQEINLPQERNSYLDLNAGLTIYNKAFYAGVALRNLTKPKRNAFGTTLNQLERALLLQAGYKTEILPEQYLAPALLFRYQNSFYQMDIGTNFDNQYFFGGLWYR
ncbi:MAG: PorP/SprF family type IX secretion system membrane protein, partial [Bernardetiaceae bacterium]